MEIIILMQCYIKLFIPYIFADIKEEDFDVMSWKNNKYWNTDNTAPDEYFPADEGFMDVPRPKPKPAPSPTSRRLASAQPMVKDTEDVHQRTKRSATRVRCRKCKKCKKKPSTTTPPPDINHVLHSAIVGQYSLGGSGDGSGERALD